MSTIKELNKKVPEYLKKGPLVAILLIQRDLLALELNQKKINKKKEVEVRNVDPIFDLIAKNPGIEQKKIILELSDVSAKTVRRYLEKLIQEKKISGERQGRTVIYRTIRDYPQ